MDQDIKDYLIDRGEDVDHMEKHWSEEEIKSFSNRTEQTTYFKRFMLKKEFKAMCQAFKDAFKGGRA